MADVGDRKDGGGGRRDTQKLLGMVVDGKDEGEEGGDGTLRKLGVIEFLTQEPNPSGTTLVDARNGFNNLIRLAMLWTVQHCWLEGSRFGFNWYRHWAKLLLRQPGEPLDLLLIPERGNSVRNPLDGIVQDYPPPPGQGVKTSRLRAFIHIICR